MKVWIAHEEGRSLLGELPSEVLVEVYPEPGKLPSDPADVVLWTPPFLAKADARAMAAPLTGLRAVQLLSAGAEVWIDHFPAGVTLCDAQGVHDSSTAEWAITAVLASIRDFPYFGRQQQLHHWAFRSTDELAGKRVLIVGAGSIGAAIEARLAPFEVTFTRVARRARDGVHSVDELPGLLPDADVVIVIVPLTEATTGMIDAAFLAAMPDGALLVNAARGPVFDMAAVTKEAMSGRIMLATDVTAPEPLPADHPLWDLPNVLITPHVGGSVFGVLPRAYALVGDQIRRLVAGEPLRNVVSEGY